jgi:uncharacterized protein (DUF58 family)
VGGAGRRALGSLTPRGRWVVGGALGLLAVGALLGERALVQLAVFLLALPVLSAGVVARERFRLAARRTPTPARIPRGDPAEVLLELSSTGLRTGGLWLLRERVPAELGPSPRFTVDRLPGGSTVALRYAVSGGRRGRHELGPLQLRVVDPFGLVERSATGTGTAPVLVVPRVHPLGPGAAAAGHGGGDGARRSIAVHGEDDVSIREYRHGDDLRKVHWRATARTGELMVRLEERPWRAEATLLLDTRARAHLISGAGPASTGVAPPDSFEWAVEAAASIGTALGRRGAAVRVLTDAGELGSPGGDLLERLALLGTSRMPGLTAGVDRLVRVAGEGPVVCILGMVGPDDVAELVRTRSGPTADRAILLDVASWATAARGRRPAAAAEVLGEQRAEAVRLLRAAGWRVAVAAAGSDVGSVWAELGGSPAGLAGRTVAGAAG